MNVPPDFAGAAQLVLNNLVPRRLHLFLSLLYV